MVDRGDIYLPILFQDQVLHHWKSFCFPSYFRRKRPFWIHHYIFNFRSACMLELKKMVLWQFNERVALYIVVLLYQKSWNTQECHISTVWLICMCVIWKSKGSKGYLVHALHCSQNLNFICHTSNCSYELYNQNTHA